MRKIVTTYYKDKTLKICFGGDCVEIQVPRKPGHAALRVLKQALRNIPWTGPEQWKDLALECGRETKQTDMLYCIYHYLKRKAGIFGVPFIKTYTNRATTPKYHYREFGKKIPVELVVEIAEAVEYHGRTSKTVHVLSLLPAKHELAKEIMTLLV